MHMVGVVHILLFQIKLITDFMIGNGTFLTSTLSKSFETEMYQIYGIKLVLI